ncbi:hypothetical protein D3C71_2128140 [compost metagenome]
MLSLTEAARVFDCESRQRALLFQDTESWSYRNSGESSVSPAFTWYLPMVFMPPLSPPT